MALLPISYYQFLNFLFLLLVSPSFDLYALCATSSAFEISHDHGTVQIILMPETCLMAVDMYLLSHCIYLYVLK